MKMSSKNSEKISKESTEYNIEINDTLIWF